MCTSPHSPCLGYSIFIFGWSSFFFGYFFRNCISPIVDVLEADLHTTATGVATLSSSIHLFYFAPQIAFGILLQFVSGKYVLPISVMLLGCAAILFSFSTNVLYATVISSLAGFAAAPAWLCYVVIIEDIFTRSQVPFAIGIQMTLTYCGLFLGNYVQALIYEQFGDWRYVFRGIAGLCWLSGILLLTLIKCRDRAQRIMQSRDVGDGEILSRSARELATFDGDQTRLLSRHSSSASQMRPGCKVRLYDMCKALKRGCTLKYNWIVSLWGFCGLCLVNGFIGLFQIQFLILKFGYSRETASLISGSFYLCRALSAPLYGRLAMKFSKRKIFLIFGSSLWICTLVIVYALPSHTLMVFVIALNFVSGIGGGNFGIMWTLAREYNAYYNCKDMAAGFVNTIINSAGFVAQLVIGELLDMRWKIRDGDIDEDGVRKYTVGDYYYALLIVPGAIIAAILLSCFLKETHGENLDYSQFEQTRTKNATA